MPIKNFEKFEKYFFEDNKFNNKIYEAYWNDYGRGDLHHHLHAHNRSSKLRRFYC